MKLIISLVLVSVLVGCATFVPEDKIKYVGTWRSAKVPGNYMSLIIHYTGSVNYYHATRSGHTEINLNIDRFTDDGFELDAFITTIKFKVNSPPTLVDGICQMTVDGVKLKRIDDDYFDLKTC